MVKYLLHSVLIVFVVLAVISCSSNPCGKYPCPPNVRQVLKKAGDNRGELEKALKYFAEKDDSLQFKAVCYLIGNMEGHSYVRYKLVDTGGNVVDFNVLDYPDYETMVAAWDSVERITGPLDYVRDTIEPDAKTITATLLIENVEDAFKAWREKPWAKHLSFDNFCETVLPYRGSNEPLEIWRPEFFEKYKNLPEKMTDSTDPVEAADLINKNVKEWFKFDARFYRHPTDQGLDEMLKTGMGRCEDMTNLAIYAMRANGIGITSDYTPHWANAGNNHAWNAILLPDGKVVPFMGAGEDPGKFRLYYKAAKVYRKTFAEQPDNLVFQKPENVKVPPWLRGKNYIDVTSAYTDVCDVTVNFDEPVPDSVPFAYLSVFNAGEWRAIHWGKIENNQATFTDMGKDIAYLPVFYLNEELVPAGEPFILQKDNSRKILHADPEHQVTLTVISTTSKTIEHASEGIKKSFLSPNQEYELFYWDNGWQSVGKKTAGKKPLKFKAPAGALYWMVAAGSDKDERIFTYENGTQVWW